MFEFNGKYGFVEEINKTNNESSKRLSYLFMNPKKSSIIVFQMI